MTTLRTYRRKLPFYVRARPLREGEIAYDGEGKLIHFQPGDMLIELETDRYKLDRMLFNELYEEIPDASNGDGPKLSTTESTDIREH